MNALHQRIKAELKLDLIKFYEDIQFDVDIDFQQAYETVEFTEAKRKCFLRINEVMLTRLKHSLESNMKKINDFELDDQIFQTNDVQTLKENLKKTLLDSYFFYVKHELFGKAFTNSKFRDIGLMLITDWYLTNSHIILLRSNLVKDFKRSTNEKSLFIDKDFLNLYKRFEFFINCKVCAILLERNKLQESVVALRVLRLDLGSIGSFISIDLQDNLFDHLTSLNALTIECLESNLNINANTFNGLGQLTSLTLKFKKIFIHPKSLSKLTKLLQFFTTQNYSGQMISWRHEYFLEEDLEDDDCYDDDNKLLDNVTRSLEVRYLGIDYETFREITEKAKTFNNFKFLTVKCHNLILNSQTFHNLEQLKILKLHVTNLDEIEDDVFKSLSNLRQLNLYLKNVKRIRKGIFNGLKSLDTLLIEANRCDDNANPLVNLIIDEDAFDDLTNLLEFYIDVINFQCLNQRLLSRLANLEYLCIRAMLIGKIEREIFTNLHNIWFVQFFVHTNGDQLENVFMQSSEELKNYFGVKNISVEPYFIDGGKLRLTF